MTATTNNRIHYLDIAKGILILLLLVSHFSIMVKWTNVGDSHFSYIYYSYPLFWPFFMEGFFFISGYCSNFDVKCSTFLFKQVKGLVVPWVSFVLIDSLIYNIPFMVSIAGSHIDVFWFLIALFFSKCIVFFVRKGFKNELLSLIVCFCLFVASTILSQYNIVSNSFYLLQTLSATLFVELGVYLRKHNNLYEKLTSTLLPLFAYIILCLIMVIFKLRIPPLDADYNVNLMQAPMILIWSSIGTFAILSICRRIEVNAILEFFGRNTLVIYCFHAIPYVIITYLIKTYLMPANSMQGIMFFLIAFAMELVIMTFVVKLFNLYPLRLLIGRWDKRR